MASASVVVEPEPTAITAESTIDTITRVKYCVIFLLMYGAALVLRYSDDVQSIADGTIRTPTCNTTVCVGDQAAYRSSFSLFLFFLIHALFSIRCLSCVSAAARLNISVNWFIPRFIVLVGFFVAMFFVPNNVFVVWAWFAVVLSAIFILVQLVALIGFAYAINDKIVQQEGRCYLYLALVLSLALFGLGIALTVVSFWAFARGPQCREGIALPTVSLVLSLIQFVLTLCVKRGSILVSSVVFAFTSWTVLSALNGGVSPGDCNVLGSEGIASVVIGSIVAGVSVAATVSDSATSVDSFDMTQKGKVSRFNDLLFFHVVMGLGAAYIAMIVTSWAVTGASLSSDILIDSGTAPLYAKYATALLCNIMYIITLMAPLCCKSRDFD